MLSESSRETTETVPREAPGASCRSRAMGEEQQVQRQVWGVPEERGEALRDP